MRVPSASLRTGTWLTLLLLAACTDVRGFEGGWSGPRVGDAPALRVGLTASTTADLQITTIDKHGLAGTLSVGGVISDAPFASVEGAEADVLAGMTFEGSPLRVYLAFVPTADGGGDALAVIALYDDDRLELRLLRGGSSPLYGVFALRPGSAA